MKRSLLLVFVALISAATPAFASDITRASVVAAMNDYRAEHHLPPLREDARLDAAAGDRWATWKTRRPGLTSRPTAAHRLPGWRRTATRSTTPARTWPPASTRRSCWSRVGWSR